MKTSLILFVLWLAAQGAQAALALSQTLHCSSQPKGGYVINAGDPVGGAAQGEFDPAPGGARLSGLSFVNGAANSFLLHSGVSVNQRNADGVYGTALIGTFGAAGDLSAFTTGSAPGGAGNGDRTLAIDDLESGGGWSALENWTVNEAMIASPKSQYLVAGLFLLVAGIKVAQAGGRDTTLH